MVTLAAQQAVQEVCARVRALQSPAEAQAAAAWLAQFQCSPHALPVCAALLTDALRVRDVGAAFFAAQTLAERSRAPLVVRPGAEAEAAAAWLPLAAQLLGTLRAAAACEAEVTSAVLRQLSTAVARLAVWLVDEWPTSLDEILALPYQLSPKPLTETLRALAEEPFDQRLPVDGSRRSRFLLEVRRRTPQLLAAVGAAAAAGAAGAPGGVGPPLTCAAAWLRAQLAYEEWLPMVAFAGGGSGAGLAHHPVLEALAPVMPVAVRGAGLEIDFEALKASCEVLDAILPLAADMSSEAARSTVLPLLEAFTGAADRLFSAAQAPSGDDARWADLVDVYGALLGALHAAFRTAPLLVCDAIFPRLVMTGARLLEAVGLGGALARYSEAALLGRALDAWEALGLALRDNTVVADCLGPGPQPPLLNQPAGGPEAAAKATMCFGALLAALPCALKLPSGLPGAPDDWELPNLRARAAQVVQVWCDGNAERVGWVVQALEAALTRFPNAGAESGFGVGWADAEIALWLATVVGEVVATIECADEGPPPLPQPLSRLLAELPRLPLTNSGTPAGRSALLCASAAEFVCALDPWFTTDDWHVASEPVAELLTFLFRVAAVPGARAPTAEALVVVVSNLAPALAEHERGAQVMRQLALLCLGAGATLPIGRRERVVRGALGPLLTRLSPDRLEAAIEELAAPLRAAAPPGGAIDGSDGATPELAARLLFSVLVAPQPPDTEQPLKWISAHWPWFQAAFTTWVTSEAIAEAASSALSLALARARGNPGAVELLLRVAPLLGEASARKGSTPSLALLAQLVLVFRGGTTSAAQETLAAQAFLIAEALVARGAQCVVQLHPDLFSAFLELFANALAPRCAGLVALLLARSTAVSMVLSCVAQALPHLTSPRAVCWSLLVFARLPHWLYQPATRIAAGHVLEGTLQDVAAGMCFLLATSTVAQDPEVLSALAKALLAIARAPSGSSQHGPAETARGALARAMGEAGVAAEESEMLLMQLGDQITTEEVLAEQLKDTADSWQADASRRRLLA